MIRAASSTLTLCFFLMQDQLEKNPTELEGVYWAAPDFDSHVVRESNRLRLVPLGELTVENLRLVIGQRIGLTYLVPLAIEHLEANPLVEGDCIPETSWRALPERLGTFGQHMATYVSGCVTLCRTQFRSLILSICLTT